MTTFLLTQVLCFEFALLVPLESHNLIQHRKQDMKDIDDTKQSLTVNTERKIKADEGTK